MRVFILKRTGHTLLALWIVTIIIFGLTRLSGDPAVLMAGDAYVTQERLQGLRAELGTDKPIHVQYWLFISKALMFDLGQSWYWRQPAAGLVLERFPATAQLAGAAFVVSLLVAVPAGVVSAVRRGGVLDGLVKMVALLGQSMPTFWVGLMFMLIFGVSFRLLPTSGTGGLGHLILPALTLGWYTVAALMRITRSSMLEVLDNDYIQLARIKGVPERQIIWKHALKNAAIPMVTFMGLEIARLLRGAVVVEVVFAWPGVGWQAMEAMFARDFAVVQAAVLFTTAIYLVVSFIVDLLYVYFNPRIRYA